MATVTKVGQSAAVDVYIAKAKPYAQPILTRLRAAIHAAVPEVEEAMKWSMPFFVYRGIILANMAGHKEHCRFGIWKADVQPLVQGAEKDAGGGMGSFGRIGSLEDLPRDAELKAVLLEAVRKIEAGERTKSLERPAKKVKPEVEVPEALVAALAKDPAGGEAFRAMSASCRREYCEWIGEAKREETRVKRVETAVAWIREGKGRNWKYEKG